jgi:DNA modification methylase
MTSQILHGDCREVLKTLPDNSVHCCVTSPPYFGLRDYGVAGQIGLEPTPDEYVAQLVAVFREVRRVLRDDGTCWLNLGDSYNGSGGIGGNGKQHTNQGSIDRPDNRAGWAGLKPKDLIGIPWRCAFALQADGWYLRQDIIWHKPAPMPESVTDRCTKSHEYIFLLTKSARYFYDNEAVREQHETLTNPKYKNLSKRVIDWRDRPNNGEGHKPGFGHMGFSEGGRNRRSVWTVNPQPYSQAHFATFPPALIEPCILAGTSEKGCCSACGKPWERVVEKTGKILMEHGSKKMDISINRHEKRNSLKVMESISTGFRPACTCNAPAQPCVVLDPFGGSGTTGEVAQRLGREFILIELNPAYQVFQKARTAQTGMTFV